VAAARWIEAKAGDRVDDVAQILANHYEMALDIARALDDVAAQADLESAAFRFLSLAGERARGLDGAMAIWLVERALAMAPPGHDERAGALVRYGQVLGDDGRHADSVAAVEEALGLYEAQHDVEHAAETALELARALEFMGDPRARQLQRDTVALLEALGPSPQLAKGIRSIGISEIIDGRRDAGVATIGRALAVADACGLVDGREALAFRGYAVGFMGIARAADGDPAALAQIDDGIEMATAAGASHLAMNLRINGITVRAGYIPPAESVARYDEALSFALSRGLRGDVTWIEVAAALLRYEAADHDRLLADFPELDARLEEQGAMSVLIDLRAVIIRIHLLRGDVPDADGVDWLERAGRNSGGEEQLVSALSAVAMARVRAGRRDEGRALLVELGARSPDAVANWTVYVASLVRLALELGDLGLAELLGARSVPDVPYDQHVAATTAATLVEARGDLDDAISGYADLERTWREFGVIPETAFAALGLGRCLVALGREEDARAPLLRARDLFVQLKAAPALSEIDALLDRAAVQLSG
jgi:tetratricopeptide (TPR) repeat protein